jgi:hypothetical protein
VKPGERSTLPIPDPHPSGDGWLPQWVTDQINNPGPLARRAQFTRCTRCGSIIIHGLDADQLAQEVRADPTPITKDQEIACILTDRPTWQLAIAGEEIKIIDRQLRWQTRPPKRPIVPDHICGLQFPGFVIPAQHPTERNKIPPF